MNADTEPKKIRNWFDQSQWADAVRNAAFEAGCSRILIDGDPGAGKTTLAHNIASDLGFKVISFDDDKYLAGNGTRYIEQLDLEALRNDVWRATQNS